MSRLPKSTRWPPKFFDDAIDATAVSAIVAATRMEPVSKIVVRRFDKAKEAIIESPVSGHEALAIKLHELAYFYDTQNRWQHSTSRTDLIKRLTSIKSAADHLSAALSLDDSIEDAYEAVQPLDLRYTLKDSANRVGEKIGGYPRHRPNRFQIGHDTFTDWHGAAALGSAVTGIRYLQTWATDALQRESAKQKTSRADRNKRDEALNELLDELGKLYTQCFGGQPTIGRNADRHNPTGAFFRFAKSALEAIGVKVSDEALATRIQRLKRQIKKKEN